MIKSRYWQAVRGVCILAVIMIHCPVGQNGLDQIVWLALRQLINFPVAIFIFMAGYFIKPEKVNADYIINRGGGRLLLPFLLWDVIYTVKNVLFGDNVEWKSVLFDFLTGRAAAPLYYILVLFQLTLLTPFILKKAGKKWLYLITPVYLCVIYIWTVIAGAPPRLYGTVFPAWLLFYLLGIDCRAGRLERYVQKSSGVWVIVAVGIELLETIVLYVGGCSITLASSQLKFSSCLYAATILLCLKKNEDKVQCNTWISNIGDCSFGIFFLHCMVLWIVKKILSMVGIDHCWIAFWMLTFLLTTFISYTLVMLIRNKVADMKKLRWIGFD